MIFICQMAAGFPAALFLFPHQGTHHLQVSFLVAHNVPDCFLLSVSGPEIRLATMDMDMWAIT